MSLPGDETVFLPGGSSPHTEPLHRESLRIKYTDHPIDIYLGDPRGHHLQIVQLEIDGEIRYCLRGKSLDGGEHERYLEEDETYVIGKEATPEFAFTILISRQHFTIHRQGDVFTITDTSRNGTYIGFYRPSPQAP